MKLTLLGTGGAAGTPTVAYGWGQCDQNEFKNRRMRSSISIEDKETTILVDTGPDLKEQLLMANLRHIDGVLYTHDHADHTHGIDEIREINRLMRRKIPAWGLEETLTSLNKRFSYAFEGYENDIQDPQTIIYKPWLEPNILEVSTPKTLRIGNIQVTAILQDHGMTRSLGFRFGDVAYSTDLVRMSEESFQALYNLKVWVVGCAMRNEHPTHASLETILRWVERLKPERTIITHMGISMDYQTLLNELPDGIEPGYDGMIINV